MKTLKHIFTHIEYALVQCFVVLVKSYQLLISPFLGNNCRYYPSCSQYCQEALCEHGLIKGGFFSIKRVCRCHPGYPGGYDPVPEKHSHS